MPELREAGQYKDTNPKANRSGLSSAARALAALNARCESAATEKMLALN
jgi:hypothetical protein